MKNTLRKLKKYDLLYVRWTDSYTLNHGEWTDEDDIEDIEVEIETVGLFLRKTSKTLTICQGRYINDSGAHGVFVIPLGCICGLITHQRDKC